MIQRANSGVLPALTGLRFVAALHVVLFHYGPKTAGWNVLPGWFRSVVAAGPTSVLLFFSLSGFILTYNYIDSSGRMPNSASDFWLARFARVYPTYLFAWLIYIPIALFKYDKWTFTLAGLSSVTLLQSWLPGFWPIKWNSPGWSLSVEAFLYLLFPLIAPLLYKMKMSAAVMIAVVTWTATMFITAKLPDWSFLPLFYVPSFVIGILASKLFSREAKLPAHSVWIWLALITTALLWKAVRPLIGFGLVTPLYGLLIFSLAQEPTNMIGKLLGCSRLVLLGEASYSLYLLHGPIWDYAVPAYNWVTVRSISNECPIPAIFGAYLILCLSVSIACLRIIEVPWRRRIREWNRGTMPANELTEVGLGVGR